MNHSTDGIFYEEATPSLNERRSILSDAEPRALTPEMVVGMLVVVSRAVIDMRRHAAASSRGGEK